MHADPTNPPQYTCSQPLMIAMSTGSGWLRQIAHVSSSGARSKAPAPASQPCKRTSVFRSNIGSIGISMIEIEHQRTRLRGPGVIALRRCHVRAKNNEYAELLDRSQLEGPSTCGADSDHLARSRVPRKPWRDENLVDLKALAQSRFVLRS
jgi:hypothetical protein